MPQLHPAVVFCDRFGPDQETRCDQFDIKDPKETFQGYQESEDDGHPTNT
jgi:hypothetical protein